MSGKSYDVVVVGAGNAAFCAAQAAAENGAKVLMVERAPKELMGGNSRFTAGAFRCVYDGVDDLKAIMPDLTASEIDRSDFGTYTTHQFYDDMFRITNYRTDGDLCDRLVGRSRDAMRWLHKKGMKFDPIWGRQAYLAFCPDQEREEILQRLRKSDYPEDRLARDPKQVDRVLAETRAKGYATRDPNFLGGPYGQFPQDDGLSGMAVPLLDRARVHGSINILWIRTAMTAEQCAARHLADLKAAADEIVASLRESTRRSR